MAEHGVFKTQGNNKWNTVNYLGELRTLPSYRIFTGCVKNIREVIGYRKNLISGTRIRVDLFNGFPLWKVPELLKCKNWKVDDKCKKKLCTTYYIDILN